MEGLINVAHGCYDYNFISWSAAVKIQEIIQAGEIVSQVCLIKTNFYPYFNCFLNKGSLLSFINQLLTQSFLISC